MLKLTPTEFKFAAHITNGKIAKEIASKLYRSYHTVITHIVNLKVKNGLKNSADIAREFVLEFGHPKHYIRLFLLIQFNMIANLDANFIRTTKQNKTEKLKSRYVRNRSIKRRVGIGG